jgi:hypothetical protein
MVADKSFSKTVFRGMADNFRNCDMQLAFVLVENPAVPKRDYFLL